MIARPPESDVPPHEHGSSAHWYNRGCRHPKCRAKAAEAKAKLRESYRAKLVRIPYVTEAGDVEIRWISPALAPAHHTHIPARHGSKIGRREYKCDCDPCRRARRVTPRTTQHPTEEGTQQ